jgi:aspartokinase
MSFRAFTGATGRAASNFSARRQRHHGRGCGACGGRFVYENWTDVSGLLMADPRVVKKPKSIAEVTYRELRELAYAGSQRAARRNDFPASEAGIPIQIKNTNRPQDEGTRIVSQRAPSMMPLSAWRGAPALQPSTSKSR